MKKTIHIIFGILLLLGGFHFETKAQHLPKFSLHQMNKNILNPAAITDQNIRASLFYKNQWTGMENSPVNAGLNVTNDFGGFSAGLIYLNDKAGVFQQNIIKLQYAYKLRINQKLFLNFGLAAGIDVYQINYQNLTLFHSDDPMLFTQSENSIVPDFDLGIMLTNMIPVRSYAGSKLPDNAFWAGFSIQHLTSLITTNESLRDNSYLLRHFNLSGGYQHPVSDNLKLEENLLIKYVNGVPLQMDLGANIHIDNTYFGGLSYRTGNDITFKAGITFQGIQFAYAYDLSLSKIPNRSSHEILLVYQFGQSKSVPKY